MNSHEPQHQRQAAVALVVILLLGAGTARATLVEYSRAQLDADTWRYEYTVSNDTLTSAIEEFSLYFDLALYGNLQTPLAPAFWDPIVLQPDPALPDDGLYDALALAGGIAPGESLGGYSVTFDWLGTGLPGSQPFEVVDPDTLALLESGTTTLVAVPEPTTLLLLLGGLAVLILRRRGAHPEAARA